MVIFIPYKRNLKNYLANALVKMLVRADKYEEMTNTSEN